MNDAAEFARFVEELPSVAADIVRAAHELITATDPGVTQVLWAHQRTVGYGIGPKKLSEHYAYLDVYDRHVNLGFNHGVALPHPQGLLGGAGGRFRRLRLSSPDEVSRPAVRNLLIAARQERRRALSR